MGATDWLIEYLEASGSVSLSGLWQCPAHDDSFPSMSLTEGEDGRALIYCHAGCASREILDSLGLGVVALFDSHTIPPSKYLERVLVKPSYAEFEWRNGHGLPRYQDVRMKGGGVYKVSTTYHQYNSRHRLVRHRMSDGGKSVFWQQRNAQGWSSSNSLRLEKLPLYNWRDVREAVEGHQLVVLCESESSVDALSSQGLIATTWAGGASKPQIGALERSLSNARVLFVPDNDAAGMRCLNKLERELSPRLLSWTVKIGLDGEDARDLLERLGPDFFFTI